MKAKKAIIGLLVLFGMVSLSRMAGADVYCEREVVTNYKVGTEDISKTTHQRLYLKKGILKVEDVESGEVTIVRLDSNILLKTNPSDKTYTQSDLQTLKLQFEQELMATTKRKPQVGLGQETVKKKMVEAMPKEQQGMMQEMMMAQMAKMRQSMAQETESETTPAELKQTPDIQTMSGHLAKRFKVLQSVQGTKKKIIELWVTTEVEPQNYMSGFMWTLGRFNSDVIGELKKVDGFPLQMKYRIQKGPLKGNIQKITVTKLEQKELPIMHFEIPAGYRPIAGAAVAPLAGEEEEDF